MVNIYTLADINTNDIDGVFVVPENVKFSEVREFVQEIDALAKDDDYNLSVIECIKNKLPEDWIFKSTLNNFNRIYY